MTTTETTDANLAHRLAMIDGPKAAPKAKKAKKLSTTEIEANYIAMLDALRAELATAKAENEKLRAQLQMADAVARSIAKKLAMTTGISHYASREERAAALIRGETVEVFHADLDAWMNLEGFPDVRTLPNPRYYGTKSAPFAGWVEPATLEHNGRTWIRTGKLGTMDDGLPCAEYEYDGHLVWRIRATGQVVE